MAKPSDELLAALNACVVHARDLLNSAKIVQESGRPNIAYHLATLALEEMGKRELYQIHETAVTAGEAPPWQIAATRDHVKKLFWCFYTLGNAKDIADQQQFFDKQETAADIHAIRIAGLYVENSDTGLNVPSKTISLTQSQALISLAEGLIRYAENQEPREEIPEEEIDLQRWILNAFDDPKIRKRLFTQQSIEKLKALNDVAAWTRQMKSEIESTDAELRALAEKELSRPSRSAPAEKKNRWRIQIRIRTTSNSIRSGPLKRWNERVKWIKLYPQQGPLAKEELIIELLLGDEIPGAGLWPVGLSMAIQFVIAINLATSGFWWWPLPPNQQKFYEKITDLENGLQIEVGDVSFEVFHQRAKLTDVHMDNLVQCLGALPSANDPERAPAYTYYLSGLTFISLNSIQWRCEAQAFGNFLESFKGLLAEADFLTASESTDAVVERFLNENFPDLDPPERESFLELVRSFEQRTNIPTVKLADVYLIKLLCETIFRNNIIPKVLHHKQA